MQEQSPTCRFLREKIDAVVESRIRPVLREHGGDMETVGLTDDGMYRFRYLGACATCPSALDTAENLIGKTLREAVPELSNVVLTRTLDSEMDRLARRLLKTNEQNSEIE